GGRVDVVDEGDDVGEGGTRRAAAPVAVAAERELAQVAVEEVRGDVLHPPGAGDGRPGPVAFAEAAQQGDELRAEGAEELRGVDRRERLHRLIPTPGDQRNCARYSSDFGICAAASGCSSSMKWRSTPAFSAARKTPGQSIIPAPIGTLVSS